MSTRSRKPLPKLDAPPLPGVKSFKPPGPLAQTPPPARRLDATGAAPPEVAPGGAAADGLSALPTPAQGLPNLTDAQAYWALARI